MLYGSIQRLLALPSETRLFVCHDYGTTAQGDARRSRFVTTVEEQRSANIHVGQHACQAEFVKVRTTRDATLSPPRWAGVSIPANLACMELNGIDGLMETREQAHH